MKSTLLKIPEYYLMILAIMAGYSPPFHINPIFVGMGVILVLQIIFQNRIFGLILGILFFVVNLLFLGALLSELSEFTAFTKEAASLLFVGLMIWTANIVAATAMIYKNSKTDRVQIANVQDM